MFENLIYLVCIMNNIIEAYFLIGPLFKTLSDTQMDLGIATVNNLLNLQYSQAKRSK